LKVITKILEYGLIVSMIFMILLLSVNVALRYLFSYPLSWAEEISVILLIWVTFFASGILQKRDEHVKVTYIYDALPTKIKRVFLVVGNICTCSVLIIFLISSIKLIKVQARTFTPALGLPMSICAVAVLIGIAAMMIYTINFMIKGEKK